MMTKMIAPIALALMLGALPAAAAHRSNDPKAANIESLAERLDHASSDLYREVTERAHYHGWRELRAVHALHRFEHRADIYRARVARQGADSRAARWAYRSLEHAYRGAATQRHHLGRQRRLNDEFERVDRLMDRLGQRVARLDARNHRHERRHHALRRDHADLRVAFHFGR